MIGGWEKEMDCTVRIVKRGSGIMTTNMLGTRSKEMGVKNQEGLLG